MGVYGELSLAPLLLSNDTMCWLVNMAAYEECLRATKAENFAIGSYISVLALLMNREEDVQEMRAKRILYSAWSNTVTLDFFNRTAPHFGLDYRYYKTFELLHEYTNKRWLWIAIYSFLSKHKKEIALLFTAIGFVAGLFKAIMSIRK